jgi:hypothetical protein
MAASSISPTTGPANARSQALSRAHLGAAPYIGIATISAVQAWEWLFSGLAKLLNGAFVQGFVAFVSRTPGPYGRFMKTLATSFPAVLPRLVEATELGLGLTLIAAAVVVLVGRGRLRRLAILAAGAASLVGFLTSANIAILSGSRPPWTISMAPFGTGVPVEALLAAISLAGVATAYSAWQVARR